MLDHRKRADVFIGSTVDILLKKDQPTGELTRGVVQRILTNKAYHPRGIKVMLTDGKVGRIQAFPDSTWDDSFLSGRIESGSTELMGKTVV